MTIRPAKLVRLLPAAALLLAGCAGNRPGGTESSVFSQEPYKRMAERLSDAHGLVPNRKIAVLPFSYVDGRASGDGSVISERLLTQMINRRELEAVERSLLDKVLGELKFQRSGAVDERSIKSLGKILGVDALVTGTLIRHRSGRVEINARLIKTETAAILAAAGEVVIPDWEVAPPPRPAQPQARAEARPAPKPAPRPAALPPLPPAKDPVRWWKANGNALDEITGSAASLAGAASFEPGVEGRAFSLDGYSAYISAGSEPLYDSLFDGRHPFTLTFWIKRSGKNATQGIFAKGEDPLMTALYMNNSAYNYSLTFDIKNGHGSKLEASSMYEGPALGRWEHWAASYDGSGTAAGMKLYRLGAPLRVTISGDSFGNNLMLTPSPLEFGRIAGSLNWYFAGGLDDIRIYNRALAPEEISGLAAAGRTRPAGTESASR